MPIERINTYPSNSIRSFHGEHRFLSNFYPSAVYFDRVQYRTVEHAYNAAKTLDIERREMIYNSATPVEAKRLGKLLPIRDNWNDIKIFIMFDLVFQKFFIHSCLRERLLKTGDSELIEGNNWNDTFWGMCQGKGSNYLGQILMQVRAILSEVQRIDVRVVKHAY